MPGDPFMGFDSQRPIADTRLPDPFTVADDLPSTRAPRPCVDDDFALVADALRDAAVQRVFSSNAIDCYRVGALEAVQ